MINKVYVNRTLNLKRIRFLGLDMDHTLIRYNVHAFEQLSHSVIKDKLVKTKNYPAKVLDLPFDYEAAIRGLVIDRKKGNLLKLNRHSAIRASFHGLKPIDFKSQQKLYNSTYIDLSDPSYLAIDTAFSLSLAILIAQLVDLKEIDRDANLPDYSVIVDDVLYCLDVAHRDGSLKDVVRKDLARFVIKEPEVVAGLEKFKTHGKKIFIVTNSDFHYTKLLLDHAINPFLKNHANWMELFEIVVVSAQKPRFFYDNLNFLRVNPADGSMTNQYDKLEKGIYQGGCSAVFTKDYAVQPDEILYIGDHIYGDILRLKKDCGWRTAMVIDELAREVDIDMRAENLVRDIDVLMKKKEPMEDELTDMMTDRVVTTSPKDLEKLNKRIDELQTTIGEIDSEISGHIRKHQHMYNEHWGQLMRAGNEESYFAYQVDRYACVYMAKLGDLLELSPRTYFRAHRRPLAHEIE